MSARRKNELIQCEHFRWKLYRRKGVYCADGRSNRFDLGRHSLNTRDKEKALKSLVQLNLVKCVENGLADRSRLVGMDSVEISLDQAFTIFIEDRSKARVAGGVKPSSLERYSHFRIDY